MSHTHDGTFLTKEGLYNLTKELLSLKMVKRLQIAKRIKEARELGDLSENAEYASAKEEQSFNEGRILELEETIRNAHVVSGNKKKKGDMVGIGSTVKTKMEEKEFIFEIVGSHESNPSLGKISHESPLGKAFLGKKEGERIEIEVPMGKICYTILEII